jgi:hypothetical protein
LSQNGADWVTQILKGKGRQNPHSAGRSGEAVKRAQEHRKLEWQRSYTNLLLFAQGCQVKLERRRWLHYLRSEMRLAMGLSDIGNMLMMVEK